MKKNITGYLMIAPFYTIFILFTVIPIFICIGFSFTNYDLYQKMDWVGLSNYRKMLTDSALQIALKNTFVYCLYTILPSIALGMLVAQMVNGRVYGVKLMRTGFYMPYVMSMVCVSMIWMWILDPTNGFLNRALSWLGLAKIDCLHDKTLALPTLAVISLWKNLGYNMLLFLAGMQAIPQEYYEASKLDGASAWVDFFKITVPLIKPTTFFVFVTTTISSFNVFEQVLIMTGGGPSNATTTIVHQIYRRGFDQLNMGYASAEAMLLFFIVLIITLINMKHGFEESKVDMV